MNSDATRQVPHAQRLLHRETTTVVAAKPNGALAALAEATLAAAKGDVAQGEAAVPARGRRQRRDRKVLWKPAIYVRWAAHLTG